MSEKSRRKSQKEAVRRYVEKNYSRVVMNLKKAEKERWITESQNLGFESLSEFIRWAVESKIGKPPGNC